MTLFLLGIGCGIVGLAVALPVLWIDWLLEDGRGEQ